jgi:hypothetical protein
MLLSHTPVTDIASIVDMSVTEVRRRALRIIGRLEGGNRRGPDRPENAMTFPPETVARDGAR